MDVPKSTLRTNNHLGAVFGGKPRNVTVLIAQNLLNFRKNRNSLTWVLVALTVCFTYPVLYRVSSESRAGEWEL